MLLAPMNDFTAAGHVSFNTNDVIKITEEKFGSVNKKKWAVGCMHTKESEERYQKLESSIDYIS
jgi:hypothetical protein